MKKTLAIAALMFGAVALAPSASAAVTCVDNVSYSTYLGGSCMIDGLTFSNFTFGTSSGGGASSIAASGVTVKVINGPEFGFEFDTGMSVSAGQFQDILISFVVTGPISDLHASFNGSFTGTGSTSDTETFCKNGTTLPPLSGCLQANQGQYTLTNPPFNLAPPPLVFSPTLTSIAISKDINVTGGNGTATISQITDTFSTVPEPMTLSMMGIGLLGLGLMRRRQQGKK
ncbi:MAG: hypothetical protein JWO19_1523 [Bryobacterales bacterium]|nr:hypothetical protein [Bryobacterales bacterium]